MIRSKAADSAQYQQLEKILVAAANKSNRPVALLLVLAELHAQQRQYDKSIADYREILAKDPRNYQAMNNLGLSLARAGQNLDEALKLVNDALAISGPMAEVLDSRAVVHIARQEPEKPWKTWLRPSRTTAPPNSISIRPGPIRWRARRPRPRPHSPRRRRKASIPRTSIPARFPSTIA